MPALDTQRYASMKPLRRPPPLLLGATLLFWGFQTGFIVQAIVMALIIEIAPKVSFRMEFSDEDFSRIWTFCTLLFLASAVYAFTSNEGVSNFRGLLQDPSAGAQRSAGASSARTAASLIRWLPMTLFLFIAAQAYSPREGIPLTTISLLLRKRWLRAKERGESLPTQSWNVGFPYIGVCIFASSTHSAEGTDFFWGACALLVWSLWASRSRRFPLWIWGTALAMAIGLGYFGQGGVGRLRMYLESLNPSWLANLTRRGFDPTQTKTAIGHLGLLKTSGKILIRLEPQEGSMPPTLLREAVYRSYDRQVWNASHTKTDYEGILAETNSTTFILVPGKENLASALIACFLDGGRGLLPIPETSGRLENLSAFVLQKNTAGSIVAEGPGLVIFDALYGPGQTFDSPPTGEEDLVVPPREAPALETVADELNLENATSEQKIHAVNAYFQSHFKYSTYQQTIRPLRGDETPLSRFLLRTHSGHCEYFATATVLLMRELGVPARYAVGYAVHEASGKKYVIRQRDAHAWCLAWNERRHAWQDVDTTPATWIEAESSHSPSEMISDAWSRIMFEFSKWRWGQTRMRRYILYGLVPILALLLYQIVSRAKKQRRSLKGAGATLPWPGLDSEIYKLEARLAHSGVPRSHYEPLGAWLVRASNELHLKSLEQDFRNVSILHNRYRFDPFGLSPEQRTHLKGSVETCLHRLNQALPGSSSTWERVRKWQRSFQSR